jgi:putative salt-induced outer membrane protein
MIDGRVMRPPIRFGLSAVTTLAAALIWLGDAHAQPAGGTGAGSPAATMPGETVKANTATKGTTDIAKGSFVTGGERKEDDPTYVNDVSIGAGGLFASGNARTVALTSVLRTRIRREDHQFSGAAAVNYGRAGKKGQEIDPTVENYQGLLRYDYFIANDISLFLQSTARRDRFQGLDLRLNVDPGIAYYFINETVHRLWGEIGYDLQHDVRREQDRVPKTPGPLADKTQTLHNARLFLGYENKLRKEVAFITSIEYLQNFADIETFRFIADIGLKSNVSDHFALATTYTARYENKPLPDVIELDSIASFNLVYSLF